MLKFLKKLLLASPGKSEALKSALWLLSVILVANFITAGAAVYLDDPPALRNLQRVLLGVLPFIVGYILATLGTHSFRDKKGKDKE